MSDSESTNSAKQITISEDDEYLPRQQISWIFTAPSESLLCPQKP
jgi:hypothetical protein